MNKRKFITRKDFIIILVIIVTAIIASIIYKTININDGKLYAEIRINGNVNYKVDISENRTITFKEKPNVKFEIKDSKICFSESDCKDKICIKSGFLGTKGQSAACLPNKISLRIISENK